MKSRSDQALELSDEILQNIELSEVPLQTVIQKTLRLSRLINDMDAVEWVREELKGFSKDENGYLTTTAWEACKRSNRTYYNEDTDSEKANTQSVSVLEQSIEALKERMKVAYDVNVSISSASQFNPPLPPGNARERQGIASQIANYTEKIEKVRSSFHDYIFNVNFELKFSDITEEYFLGKDYSLIKN